MGVHHYIHLYLKKTDIQPLLSVKYKCTTNILENDPMSKCRFGTRILKQIERWRLVENSRHIVPI
jgi:hypothetical protein